MCKVWNGILNVDLTDLVGASGVPVEKATGLLMNWRRILLEGRLAIWAARNAIVHSPDREAVRVKANNVEKEAKRFCTRHSVDADIAAIVSMDDGARQQWYARVRSNQREGRQRQPRMDELFEISDKIGPERRDTRQAQGARKRQRERQTVMDQFVTKRARVEVRAKRTTVPPAVTANELSPPGASRARREELKNAYIACAGWSGSACTWWAAWIFFFRAFELCIEQAWAAALARHVLASAQ